MGLRDKLRIDRIRQGFEVPRALKEATKIMPQAPRAMARMAKAVAKNDASVMYQAVINWVDGGILSASKAKSQMVGALPKEVRKERKKNQEITTQQIMDNLYSQVNFEKCCDKIGLSRKEIEDIVEATLNA